MLGSLIQAHFDIWGFGKKEEARLQLERKEQTLALAISELDNLISHLSDVHMAVAKALRKLRDSQFPKSTQNSENDQPSLPSYLDYCQQECDYISTSFFRLKEQYGVPLDHSHAEPIQGALVVLFIWSERLRNDLPNHTTITSIPTFFSVPWGVVDIPPVDKDVALQMNNELGRQVANQLKYLSEIRRKLASGALTLHTD